MKHLFTLKTIMLACLLFVGMGAWAEEETATLTFNAACGGSGADDKGNSWTVTSDASESAYDATKGIHYGTGKAAVSYLTLTNSSITGTISKIVVNASGASGTSAIISLKVGGSAFGSQQSLTSSNAAYTFNGSSSGNIEISLTQTSATKALYVKSVAVTYSTVADTRTAVNMTGFSATSTTLVKGGNTSTTVTNDQNGWTPAYTYQSSNTNVATVSNSGVITAVAKGNASITATLNIANDDANWKKGATTSKTIDITVNNPSHTAHFSVNGTIDPANDANIEEGENITFPTDPEVDDVVFKGWATAAIVGTQNDAPEFVNTATVTMGANDVTYYAVFATQDGEPAAETKTQTLQYDTWTYSGSTTNKNGYRLFHSGSYIESASFDRSKLSKVVVYGGTFGGASYNKLTIGDGTNTWKSVTVSGSSETGVNTYTDGTALSGTGTIRITSNSGSASNTGVRISKVEIYTMEGGYTYSDYCTTVALDPKPTLVVSATELAEYAGNTNTSITASVSEGAYTGALTVASSADAVATASISEGTISIQAVAAGNATITVTAPAVTGFRKATATIAVTVSEKLAHGLAFDAATLNLTVGDTEFTEPTLSNPNSLPIVYSLVYATPANEGKVATINATTGKLTLADPSLSTETQGAVTVKASTVGDNSHAAGEVTYNLVVARKVTTTSWSNGGAAVNIDQDEIATLPTASNDGERNLFYESSNTDVATIDNTGAVTFVAYGTTTITAKTSATPEYAATSASYTLTFAPRYTVTFSINGEETVLREETSGAGVIAPSVDPIAGKVFRGWAEGTIDGTTNVAPAFVNASSLSVLNQNKTLYAVFATQTGNAEITYTKLESTSFDNSAEYVLAAEETSEVSTLHYFSSYTGTSANESWGITSTDADDAIIFSLSGTANALVVQDASGNYLEALATGKFKMSSESTTVKLDNGKIYNPSSTYSSYNLRYNHNNGSGGFRWYSNTTGTSAYFYKKEGGATYSYFCTTIPSTVDVTIGATGYATFVAPCNMDFEGTTVTAYLVNPDVANDVVHMTSVDKVPAGTALVVKGTSASVPTTASADPVTTALEASATAITATAEDTETYYYLGQEAGVVGFRPLNVDGTLAVGKCFFKVAKSGPARFMRIATEGETTGIKAIESAKNNAVVYNLAGQRVAANAKGIVIVNGKKMLNK